MQHKHQTRTAREKTDNSTQCFVYLNSSTLFLYAEISFSTDRCSVLFYVMFTNLIYFPQGLLIFSTSTTEASANFLMKLSSCPFELGSYLHLSLILFLSVSLTHFQLHFATLSVQISHSNYSHKHIHPKPAQGRSGAQLSKLP